MAFLFDLIFRQVEQAACEFEGHRRIHENVNDPRQSANETHRTRDKRFVAFDWQRNPSTAVLAANLMS